MQERITHREFLEWLEFLAWEDKRETVDQIYLAQIAAEVRRGRVKHPGSVKLSQFILKFKEPSVAQPKAASHSKQTWATILKVDLNKN